MYLNSITMKPLLTKYLVGFGLLLVGGLLLLALKPVVKAPAKPNRTGGPAARPNIIYILADDLGYGNLTCYNPKSRIPTPNLDRMAAEGTRFTRFYAGSTVCAPSRCALMTGRDMGHAYIRGNGGELFLRPQDTTLAQRLRANGYATGMFGKWGLGDKGNTGEPHRQGFDEFFGYMTHREAHNYFTDHLWEDRHGQVRKIPLDTTQYTHDLIMERALAFIRDHKLGPFFMYLPVTIPHAELQTADVYMKPFLNADGSSKFPPETPFVQRAATYHSQANPHAAFAAMLTKLDSDMGRLIALLKETGLDGNTVVLFTSDNGPHEEGGADPVYFNSGGPLRGIKRDLYEGGIRVPMLVRAPGRVPAGKVSDQIWANWDILPTLCQMTNAPIPTDITGLSFSNTVLGSRQARQHNSLYWQFNEGVLKEAVLQGNWKLVRLKEKGKSEVLELYDLSTDVGEQRNIAATNAQRVKTMYSLMQQAKTPPEHPRFDYSAFEQ